jgi:hypothetical protein
MAADVQNDTIIISHDGGQKWSPDDKLANLITDNGDYLFSKGRFSLVTNITFDPERPCRILIGTRQNGVFYTVNGGHDWQKVSGSKYLYNISSFFFAGKHIYASTYGRGLFRLNLDEGQTSCLYAKPPKGGPLVDGFKVVKLDTLDESAWEGPLKSYCDECTYALATEGHVTEIEKEGNQVSRIGIVGGSFVHLAPGAEPIPLPFSVTVQKRLGEQGGDVSLQSIARGPEPIRGLILRGREIEALIVGVSPYKMEALPPARITLQADIEGGSGMYLPAGAPLTVFGSGFMPTGDGTQIRVYLDEELVKESETDEQGAFALSLTPDLHVGNYTLLVTQEGSARFVSAETDLNIVVADREE